MQAENLIKGIAAAGYANLRRRDGDYIQDGLLFCGRCHGAREIILPEPFSGVKVPCMCQCDIQREEEEQRRKDEESKALIIKARRKVCFTSQLMEGWNFENDNGSVEKLSFARDYAHKWGEMLKKNIGCYIFGEMGTGKSYAAACIANAVISQGYTALFRSMPELINGLYAAEDKNAFITQLVSPSLLILDDFGTQRRSEYASEQVFNIIDARYRSGKPLIITSNLSMKEVREKGDGNILRAMDRISELCLPVIFDGDNQRKEKRDRKREALKAMMKQ